MRRAELVWAGLVALTFGAGCDGCTDDRSFTGTYFEPYEYGTYNPVRAPRLEAPDRVSFGALGVREFATREVELANVGRAPLKLQSIEIDPMFSLRFPAFMDGKMPEELAPGERVVAQLGYVSGDGMAYTGELALRTNDPARPEHVITLSVNQSLPCLEVIPSPQVSFGQVQPARTVERTVELRSCSDDAVTQITSVDLDRGGRNFTSDTSVALGELGPGESRRVKVFFQPFEPTSYVAYLNISSDDPTRPEQQIELVGRGAPFPCPEPQIVANIPERGVSAAATPTGTLRARPLDRVLLDAGGSVSPDGALISRVEWALISRPPDSSAAVEVVEGSTRSELFLDLTGDYVLEMTAFDERGVPSCEPAMLKIEAVPHEDIHVQLVWDTPADADQLDMLGSDLDLHMMNGRGRWNDPRWDCFWQNLSPEWGAPGAEDNPSLDIDDVDGLGPENINLSNPGQGESYQVGVHYFAAQGFGRSFATVRVYIRGELSQELRRKPIEDQGFWRVLDIQWPSRQIVVWDEMFSTIP